MFESKNVPDYACRRKPDGVQVPESVKDFEVLLKDVDFTDPKFDPASVAGWCKIFGTFEFKTSLIKRLDAIFQCAGGARNIFNKQLDRRFVVGYTLTGELLTVIAFDRSGWVASKPFNINKDPGLFLHVVVGSLYVDENFGLDPTVRLRGEKKEIEVDGEWYDIVKVIHIEGVLRGRATICYHVRKDEEDYVVKDCWVDRSRADKEADILKDLQGIEHVPEVIKDVVVKIDGRSDTTAYFRRAKGDDGTAKTYKDVEIREHRRMLMKPLARKLSDFRDLVELITAVRDIVDGKFQVKQLSNRC